MRMIGRTLCTAMLSLIALLVTSCGGGAGGPGGDTITFTVAGLPLAKVGEAYSYSFCQPALSQSTDLCAEGSTNPTGGQPPYHFQLGAGVGFPPLGLTLGVNGILSGTPSASGPKTFEVCAVDLSASSTCRSVNMTVGEGIGADPDSVVMQATSCYPSQCTVSQTVTITSSTTWTSTAPGFGSLGSGFAVTPSTGPIGSTPVTISYTASVPLPANGFIRFRTTTVGVYVEVPVIVTVY